MASNRPRFSIYAHFYLWLCVGGLCVAPVVAMAAIDRQHVLPTADWVAAAIISVGLAGALWYANARCSSERLTYWEGLLFVAASMMTGWSYLSMVLVFPALLVTIMASIGFSIFGDLSGIHQRSADQFARWVSAIYRHRMHQ